MLKKTIRKIATSTLLLLGGFLVYGEEYQDEDVIVVSSSKIDQSADSAVEKVNVISEEELENKGAKTIADALRSIPGVTVSNSVLKNKSSSVMIQGFEGQYVKILIDGVAVSAENAGAVYLERIPVENIDHIEIVQGASSALYGSDALGGVINIITKKPETGEKEIKVGGHLYEDYATSVQNKVGAGLSLAANNFSASANGSFDWHKGSTEEVIDSTIGAIDVTKTPNTRLGYADARIGWDSTTWKIALSGLYSDYYRKTTNIGTSRRSKYVSKNDYSEQRLSGTLSGEKELTDTISVKAFASAKKYDADLDETKLYSTSAATDSEAKLKEVESEAQLSWNPNDYHSLVVGLNGKTETGSGTSFEGSKTQALFSFFAQDDIDFTAGEKALVLSLGGRFDFQPKIDDCKRLCQATPKAGIKFSPFEETTLRLSYGMGYKLPALNQKYYVKYHSHGNSGFYIYGNKELDPELSHSFNFNIEQKIIDSIKFSAGGFYNRHKNMIDTHKVENGSSYFYEYENLSKAFTYGGSLGASGKFERVDFYLNYAYTVAKKIEDDEELDLTYRVPHRIAAGISCMIPVIETQVGFDGEWNSPQIVSEDGEEKSPDLLLLNFSVRKKFFDNKVEIYARGENILNNRHLNEGSNDESQEDFFALFDGPVFHFGTRIKL